VVRVSFEVAEVIPGQPDCSHSRVPSVSQGLVAAASPTTRLAAVRLMSTALQLHTELLQGCGGKHGMVTDHLP
jgi:hypothetical protein